MGRINLGEAFPRAWRMYFEHPGVMLFGAFMLIALNLVLGLGASYRPLMAVFGVTRFTIFMCVLISLITPFLRGGMWIIVKKAYDHEAPGAADAFQGFSRFAFFVGGLITYLALISGAIVCLIGAIFTMALVVFVFPMIADGDTASEAWRKNLAAFKSRFGACMATAWLPALITLPAVAPVFVAAFFRHEHGHAAMPLGWHLATYVLLVLLTPFAASLKWVMYRQIFGAPNAAANPAAVASTRSAPPITPQ
jgi:hypothetical protein